MQQASHEHLTQELARVRSESEQALETQLIAASAEAERVRIEATREAREAAESAAGEALKSEIARVRAETEQTLAIQLVKLRGEDDERRKQELAEITAQVAQLKDDAAEQAKAAAPTGDDLPTPDTTDSAEISRKDYYSLWHPAEGAGTESDEPAVSASRTSNLQRIVFGGVAAACILVGVMLGTGGVEETETGSIRIDGPPGAQVWVEGTLIGETPLPEISAELGEHEVVVIHPETGEIRRTVTVVADAPAVLSLDQ